MRFSFEEIFFQKKISFEKISIRRYLLEDFFHFLSRRFYLEKIFLQADFLTKKIYLEQI